MKTYSQRGFTLVEVMVAISIFSFLSSVAFYFFGTARANAQDAVTLATAVATKDAIHQYVEDSGSFPLTPNTVAVEGAANGLWNGAMQNLVTAGLLNRIPGTGNPKKKMWIAKFTNLEGQQLIVLGFSYKNNSTGGVIGDQCNPFSPPGGGDGDGGQSSVSQNAIDPRSQLAQVGGAGEEAGEGESEAAQGEESGGNAPTCPPGQILFGGMCIDFVSAINGNGNNYAVPGSGGQSQNSSPPVNEQGMDDGSPPADPCAQFSGTCTCIR